MGLCENCGVRVAGGEPHKCPPVTVKLEKPEVVVIKEERFEDDEKPSAPFDAADKNALPSVADESTDDGPRLKCPNCSFQPRHLETLNNHLILWCHTNNEDSHGHHGQRKRHYYRSGTFRYSNDYSYKAPQQLVVQRTQPKLVVLQQQDAIRQQVVHKSRQQLPRQVILARRVVVANQKDSHVKFKRYYECLHCDFKDQNDAAVKEHVTQVHSSKLDLQSRAIANQMM